MIKSMPPRAKLLALFSLFPMYIHTYIGVTSTFMYILLHMYYVEHVLISFLWPAGAELVYAMLCHARARARAETLRSLPATAEKKIPPHQRMGPKTERGIKILVTQAGFCIYMYCTYHIICYHARMDKMAPRRPIAGRYTYIHTYYH